MRLSVAVLAVLLIGGREAPARPPQAPHPPQAPPLQAGPPTRCDCGGDPTRCVCGESCRCDECNVTEPVPKRANVWGQPGFNAYEWHVNPHTGLKSKLLHDWQVPRFRQPAAPFAGVYQQAFNAVMTGGSSGPPCSGPS